MECSIGCSLITAIISILLFIIAKFFYNLFTCHRSRPGKPTINKKNWEHNVVYLYQFPRSKSVANASPFCLKVEAFLRHYNIKHEIVESLSLRSKEGKMPFVELNGEQIADSQLIILALMKHFSITDNLSPEQDGMVRAISRMVEHGTFAAIYYDKLGTNTGKFLDSALEGTPAYKFRAILTPLLYSKIWEVLNAEGTGRHSPEEIQTILRADLQALDQILGDKQWLVGNQPTVADFTVFGHIAASYDLPYEQPIQRMIEVEFPRLKAHHDRMVDKYFPEHNFGRYKR
ncbi:failed axon connection [Ditylenchus destructor]|nr:failed axon connection [Ditylenchus destructor]